MTVRAARVPVPGVPPFGFSAQYPIVAADVDRRNQFEHDGLEFLDRRSPYTIILKFDVPRYIIYSGYYDMNTYLLNRLHRAVRRGNLANPSTNPDDRSVRIVLTYSLADLDQVSFREVQTAVTALERIAFILRSRTTYETLTKELLPWSPEPQRLDAVRIYKTVASTTLFQSTNGICRNVHPAGRFLVQLKESRDIYIINMNFILHDITNSILLALIYLKSHRDSKLIPYTMMSDSIYPMHLSFKPTLNDLDRQKKLEAKDYEFEGGCPFTINMYGYVHESVICSGIEKLCNELSRQFFIACMENSPSPKTSLPRRNKEYYRVKVTFNIATVSLNQKPEPEDDQVIATAVMWHLGSRRTLRPVNNAFEKWGRCRGQDIVVLRVKVVPEGAKDCAYFFPQGLDASLESVKESEYDDDCSDQSDIDGWVFV
ncbi:uncharacterized protein KD926_011013 [Aspergillus affinis]|uniref:uncharacterized protein n=1 Tax=Aspergillus affinis TaxID=1070780 RepID=UPI0022FEEA89|nr:uncharacterized protein KD926_011013 [Aspergillus affinis]KAI9044840.1 hypothetical protein KD926_011013 [Aspergillus affinis]